jgi:hypothetical protein
MYLDRAKNRLQDGYCLWVGAGVTKQLWPGAPQWGELTKKLEALAELADDCSLQYPERLGRCSDKLGSDMFRKHLREDLLHRSLRGSAETSCPVARGREWHTSRELQSCCAGSTSQSDRQLQHRAIFFDSPGEVCGTPALFHLLIRKLRGSNSESLLRPFKESCTIRMAYRPPTA